MAPARRADVPFPEALRTVLAERTTLPAVADQDGTSPQPPRATLNALASRAGVVQSHLWRVVNRPAERRASLELIAKVAGALGLPTDYFLEIRTAVVADYLQSRPQRLNRLYAEARRATDDNAPHRADNRRTPASDGP